MIFLLSKSKNNLYFKTILRAHSKPAIMNRRKYLKTTGMALAATQISPLRAGNPKTKAASIPLGGKIFEKYSDPEAWVGILKKVGFTAAYCPVKPGAPEEEIRAYEKEARKNDIVIAEVGTWSNTISDNPEEAKKALEKNIAGLQLADQIGSRCCVNTSGSKNAEYWAGPHKDNLTDETFEEVVEVTRRIIDAVKPSRTYFVLEAMPWAYPDSTETYLKLLKAIDRKQFGVHLDPVNMITSVRDYYGNAALIKEMFAKLGPHIKSCHAKDIIIREDNYIPQLDELRPGLGTLDYSVYLRELGKLDNVPLMIEHLDTAEEYGLAADHIRKVGETLSIDI